MNAGPASGVLMRGRGKSLEHLKQAQGIALGNVGLSFPCSLYKRVMANSTPGRTMGCNARIKAVWAYAVACTSDGSLFFLYGCQLLRRIQWKTALPTKRFPGHVFCAQLLISECCQVEIKQIFALLRCLGDA